MSAMAVERSMVGLLRAQARRRKRAQGRTLLRLYVASLPRSLIDWIISSEITGDVYESALYTIISKATADELDREALISTVLEPIFAPKRHKASA